MTFLEYLGLIVSGAGTLASILGVSFALYAKHNGKATREFIASQNKDMREFIAEQNKEMRNFLAELITSQNKEMRNFTAEVLTKIDEHADGRHREIMEMLKR